MKKTTKQIRAVIYARYSSHQQSEQSIDGQLRDCYKFAEQNNIKIVGEYIDRALSAKTDHRPEFQRMIKDSERHIFDVILVWKLDRFARNRFDSANYKARLKRNGAKIMSVMENISDSPEGILMESLLEGMAEYYSAELAEKVKRGMRETALNCRVYGMVPYGYKSVDKKFVIDEDTAPIVRQIFNMYIDGMTAKQIAEYLNAANIKNRKGHKFSIKYICNILSNKKYTGLYIYDDIIIPGGIPEIIDNETFDRAQKVLKKNKTIGAKYKASEEYILTTKLFCGECRSMMRGDCGTGKGGGIYYYYSCANKRGTTKKCKKKSVRKSDIEKFIIDNIVNNILQDSIINKIADNVMTLQQNARNNAVIDCLNKQLNDTNESIKNVMHAIEQGIVTQTTVTRLKELEETQDYLKLEIDKEKSSLLPLSRDEIVYLLDSLRNGDPHDIKYQKRLIDVFIHRIYIYDDKLLITYNYSNRENKTNEKALSELISDSTLNGDP